VIILEMGDSSLSFRDNIGSKRPILSNPKKYWRLGTLLGYGTYLFDDDIGRYRLFLSIWL
jgi:hypothetical protein